MPVYIECLVSSVKHVMDHPVVIIDHPVLRTVGMTSDMWSCKLSSNAISFGLATFVFWLLYISAGKEAEGQEESTCNGTGK